MLKEKITQLYQLTNKQVASESVQQQIEDILVENELDTPENVPSWFTDFLDALINKTTTEKVKTAYNSEEGDTANLLAELEDIIDADWNDYGEVVEVKFSTLNLHAIISAEDDFFQVKPLVTNTKEIIHKEPWKYTFFKENNGLFLDVICGGAAMYTLTVQLNQLQEEKYQKEGLPYIATLAKKITKSPSDFKDTPKTPT